MLSKTALAGLLIWASISVSTFAQTPTRNERREAKVRSEYFKATADIRVPTIRVDSLKAELDDTNLILIDVRQPPEQMVSMLPNAMTPYQFSQKFQKGFPKTKHVVAYCTLGFRSGKYAEQLQAKGIAVQNLEGGILMWTHVNGLLLRDSSGIHVPTKKVNVYAADMQKWIALDYEAVW